MNITDKNIDGGKPFDWGKTLFILIFLIMNISGCSNQKIVDDASYSKFLKNNYELESEDELLNTFLIDLNHDGEDELIVVNQKYTNSDKSKPGHGDIKIYTKNDNNEVVYLWDQYIHSAQNTYVYVVEVQGENYIMQFHPTAGDRVVTYSFSVFYFSEGGDIITLDEKENIPWKLEDYTEEENLQMIQEFKSEMENYMEKPIILMEFGQEYPDYKQVYRYTDSEGNILD